MTDIKKDFLYEFNRGLREIYSNNPSIISVFENIDNGSLKLSPVEIPELEFVNEVGKCIFMLKKILIDPHKVIVGKQEIVPVSQAKNVDHESIKLTLADPTLWSIEKGKIMPKQAYSIVNEDVFINYENAFIYQLIKLLIVRLKKIKINLSLTLGVESNDNVDEKVGNANSLEFVSFYSTVNNYIKKLSRLSNEKAFLDNSKQTVDLTNVFVTDIIKTDKRYNYCYKFLCTKLLGKKSNVSKTTDFRVLYHNFALTQVMYQLYKNGYQFANCNYRIPVSGKMFIDNVECFNDDKQIVLSRTNNGVDVLSCGKIFHIEFSKSLIANKDINEDCVRKTKTINQQNKYEDVFVAYLSSETLVNKNALNIGYRSNTNNIDKLIKTL